MQASLALFHTPGRSQLEPSLAAFKRRREFIDLRTLMLLRSLGGPGVCAAAAAKERSAFRL
jgi:hypothetical protein